MIADAKFINAIGLFLALEAQAANRLDVPAFVVSVEHALGCGRFGVIALVDV
jgi:hypothetical protein